MKKEMYLGTDGRKREMPNLFKLLEVWKRHPKEEEGLKEEFQTMFDKYIVSGTLKEQGFATLDVFKGTKRSLKVRLDTMKITLKACPELAEEIARQEECVKWLLKKLDRRIRKIKIAETNKV